MVENERLIELKNISKEFDGTTVLDNINLYIRKKDLRHCSAPPAAARPPPCALSAASKRPPPARCCSKGVTLRRCRPTSAA